MARTKTKPKAARSKPAPKPARSKRAPKPAAGAPAKGRSKRSPNYEYLTAEATTSVCPRCGTTNREDYFKKREFPVSHDREGRPATHVVLRWTRCTNPECKQSRIDRSYENRVA